MSFRASLCCLVLAFVCEFAAAQALQADKSKAKKTAALPVGVRVERNLEYARRGEQRMLLDLYLPEKPSEQPLPVVVWIHGGGWSAGSKDRCPAGYLAAEGFAVASINYRLSQEARWPAQIDDCRDAIRWLRMESKARGFDGEHIGVWGGSAGGHLVALLGTLDVPSDEAASSRVQAVCDFYGPSDLLTMPPNVLSAGKTEADLANANGAKLLGGIVRDRPELARQASALYQVGPGDAPFLIMHGDADPQVPLEQSERLNIALTNFGVASTFRVVSGGHGGPGFQTEEVKQLVLAFFRKHLSK